jgi:hypothetical protein
MLSVSSARTTRPREAPSASRTLISRLRVAARASIRLATLAHAISSTNATAIDMIVIISRMPRRHSSANPDTLAVQPFNSFGYCFCSRE